MLAVQHKSSECELPSGTGLDNAGGVHVGDDDVDFGTGDQVNESKSVHDATMMCKGVMNATEMFNTRHMSGGRTARHVSSLAEETGTGRQEQAGGEHRVETVTRRVRTSSHRPAL